MPTQIDVLVRPVMLALRRWRIPITAAAACAMLVAGCVTAPRPKPHAPPAPAPAPGTPQQPPAAEKPKALVIAHRGASALRPEHTLAAYTKAMSLEQIMGDIMIAYPNTRPMCSANCDGAAAAVVVSGARLKTLSKEQQKRAIKVSASVLTSDPYTESCQVLPDVNTLTKRAADQAYEQAGVSPADLDLVELHDCFATAELVHYDNLRLCEEGGYPDVEPAVVADGLSALTDGLWLDLLVRPESMSRERARRITLSYLADVFPRHFRRPEAEEKA